MIIGWGPTLGRGVVSLCGVSAIDNQQIWRAYAIPLAEFSWVASDIVDLLWDPLSESCSYKHPVTHDSLVLDEVWTTEVLLTYNGRIYSRGVDRGSGFSQQATQVAEPVIATIAQQDTKTGDRVLLLVRRGYGLVKTRRWSWWSSVVSDDEHVGVYLVIGGTWWQRPRRNKTHILVMMSMSDWCTATMRSCWIVRKREKLVIEWSWSLKRIDGSRWYGWIGVEPIVPMRWRRVEHSYGVELIWSRGRMVSLCLL